MFPTRKAITRYAMRVMGCVKEHGLSVITPGAGQGKEVCGMGRSTQGDKLESKAESRYRCYYSQSERL